MPSISSIILCNAFYTEFYYFFVQLVQEAERPTPEPGAAVDCQDLAGDVRGLRGGEEGDGVGDLFGLAPPAERHGRR